MWSREKLRSVKGLFRCRKPPLLVQRLCGISAKRAQQSGSKPLCLLPQGPSPRTCILLACEAGGHPGGGAHTPPGQTSQQWGSGEVGDSACPAEETHAPRAHHRALLSTGSGPLLCRARLCAGLSWRWALEAPWLSFSAGAGRCQGQRQCWHPARREPSWEGRSALSPPFSFASTQK